MDSLEPFPTHTRQDVMKPTEWESQWSMSKALLKSTINRISIKMKALSIIKDEPSQPWSSIRGVDFLMPHWNPLVSLLGLVGACFKKAVQLNTEDKKAKEKGANLGSVAKEKPAKTEERKEELTRIQLNTLAHYKCWCEILRKSQSHSRKSAERLSWEKNNQQNNTKGTPVSHQTTNNTTLWAPTSIIMNEPVLKQSKSEGDKAKEVYQRGATRNLSRKPHSWHQKQTKEHRKEGNYKNMMHYS